MKTILLVFGTRPEAIKMCPLVKELNTRPGVRTVVCVTGQHREMLTSVLHTFAVAPDHDLAIHRKAQTLADITTAVLAGLSPVLDEVQPDLVLVHGDTTTAFAAAMACFYRHIPVGHVEAGLRTNDPDAPFPEEFNRQAIDFVSRYHFAPTDTARDNLLREGKSPESIFVTGNTVIDALKATVRPEYAHPQLTWAADSRLLLLTAHRRENIGKPLEQMFRAIRRVADDFPGIKILYPIHPNPEVRKPAEAILGDHKRIHLVEPLDVPDFHNFLSRCHLVVTDSGGIQEEATALGKPVLVMRRATERPEGIAAGTLKLVGTEEGPIYEALHRLLTDPAEYRRMSTASDSYGDGSASRRIADILTK